MHVRKRQHGRGHTAGGASFRGKKLEARGFCLFPRE